MIARDSDSAIAYAITLLSHYGFELKGYTAQELVELWLEHYEANWVLLAAIEALYQGRYKAISVEQILAVWSRRDQPMPRFTHEFERLICRNLPQDFTSPMGDISTELIEESNFPPVTAPFDELVDKSEDTTHQQFYPPQPEYSSACVPPELPHVSLSYEKQSENTPPYEIDWSRCEVSKQPIDQFTPPPDSSDFYLKLKKVVEKQERSPDR